MRAFLDERSVRLEDVEEKEGFERNAVLLAAKEAINADDDTRKRFEIMARAVFAKFKACLTSKEVNSRRLAQAAINFIYRSLEEDRKAVDISHIIKALHEVVGYAIQPRADGLGEGDQKLYDISAIDFERLRQEFERSPVQNTQVRALRDVIERRLARMVAQNPLRMNFQRHYEELVAEYNGEKDRVTIEATFEALMRLYRDLDEEEERAVELGLDEETLPLFDLLKKPELSSAEINKIKILAEQLYAGIQEVRQEVHDWRSREATRDRVRQLIFDTLYSDDTGLPESYSDDEIAVKSEDVFGYVLTRQAVGAIFV